MAYFFRCSFTCLLREHPVGKQGAGRCDAMRGDHHLPLLPPMRGTPTCHCLPTDPPIPTPPPPPHHHHPTDSPGHHPHPPPHPPTARIPWGACCTAARRAGWLGPEGKGQWVGARWAGARWAGAGWTGGGWAGATGDEQARVRQRQRRTGGAIPAALTLSFGAHPLPAMLSAQGAARTLASWVGGWVAPTPRPYPPPDWACAAAPVLPAGSVLLQGGQQRAGGGAGRKGGACARLATMLAWGPPLLCCWLAPGGSGARLRGRSLLEGAVPG